MGQLSTLALPLRARTKPTLNVGVQDLALCTEGAIGALRATNDPPQLFQFGGFPARLEYDDDGYPKLSHLTPAKVRHELAERCECYRLKDGRETAACPPRTLASPTSLFPVVHRVVHAPVFSRVGTISTDAGYNPDGRTYLADRLEILPEYPDRYRATVDPRTGETIGGDILLESLGLRLDLLYEELKLRRVPA